MATGDKGSTNIIELSRNERAMAAYTETKTGKDYQRLYEAITAGSLQRIANSLESIAKNIANFNDKQPDRSNYHLQKQVTKLSMRLKKAGLPYKPDQDLRKDK